MADPFKTVLLLGAPGAGKGTQGKLLSNVPGFHHMSTGDMFRNLDLESETGREIKGFMTRGELVPDELTVRLWRENIRARVTLGLFKPAMEILLLDGLPRNTAQADLIAEDCDVLAVAHLMAKDEEAMIERLKGYPLLTGARGARPVALSLIEESLLRLSWLVQDLEDDLEELDLNPFIVTDDPKRSFVVDARIRLRP